MADSAGDKRWRSREGMCAFLSFVPVLGSFGFFYMYHRSGRKQYRNFGIIHVVLAALGMALFLGWVRSMTPSTQNMFYAFEKLIKGLQKYYSSASYAGYFYDVMGMLPAVFFIYLACIVHTLSARKNYLKYMEQVVQPYRVDPAIVSDCGWRRRNQLWLAMSFIPSFNGLALHFAGRRMKKKRLEWRGLLLLLLSFLLFVAMQLLYDDYFATFSNVISRSLRNPSIFFENLCRISGGSVTAGMFLFIVYVAGILLAFMYRRDYLLSVADQWAEDIQVSSNYADGKWRRANSGWQIWSCLPFVGGVGLIRGGVVAGKKKVTCYGVLLLVLNLVVFLLTLMEAFRFNEVNSYGFGVLSFFFLGGQIRFYRVFWLLTIYIGCLYRREILLSRAVMLGEYASDIEKEIALQKRYRSRGAQDTSHVLQEPPKPAEEKQAKHEFSAESPSSRLSQNREPAPEQENLASTIDINTCTKSELTALPGITLADANRAMEYRSEKGGFRSVDEFVDTLGIKPHFAAQIFKLATASQIPAGAEKAEQAPGHARRRSIDL